MQIKKGTIKNPAGQQFESKFKLGEYQQNDVRRSLCSEHSEKGAPFVRLRLTLTRHECREVFLYT